MDLSFLSSRQAIGDIAAFVGNMEAKYSLTDKNRWVTFGGSYPGMLASFARIKLPHLIYASASSSAPVEAQVDMTGYNDVTAEAYAVSDEGVGKFDECAIRPSTT